MRLKKIIFLPIMTIAFATVACEKQKGVLVSSPKYQLDITGSKDMIMGGLKSGKFVAGETITFKVESVTDVTFYPYLNNERLTTDKYDDNYNAIYEFVMPDKDSELAIGDWFYVDRVYTLKEIFPDRNIINGATVTKVIIESGTYGTVVDFKTVTESTNVEDINYNVDIYLNEPFHKKDDFVLVDGGGYSTLKLVTENSVLTINFPYGMPTWNDFSGYQRFDYANKTPRKPKIEHPDSVTTTPYPEE